MELSTPALARWLAAAVAAEHVEIAPPTRLGGGAIQENWAFDCEVSGGPRHGRHSLVLRTSARSALPVSWDRAQEFAVLSVAHRAGVTVPEPWGCCADPAVLGRPFFVMARCPGEARGPKLVRDPGILAAGGCLLQRLATELARLHRLAAPIAELAFIPLPQGAPSRARIDEYRSHLDRMGATEPTLEWALSWLARDPPDWQRPRLLHADFRIGNILIDGTEISAILDWEFAAFGDPREDLGWFLCRFWRFGAWQREAGGIGDRATFLDAYEAASGVELDRSAVAWWEVMATVRWAVIALMQAGRHAVGGEASLELALTAHLLPQLELDLLRRIDELEPS